MVSRQRLITRQGVKPANFLKNLSTMSTLFPQQLLQRALALIFFKSNPQSSPHCLKFKSTSNHFSTKFFCTLWITTFVRKHPVKHPGLFTPRTQAPHTWLWFCHNLKFWSRQKKMNKKGGLARLQSHTQGFQKAGTTGKLSQCRCYIFVSTVSLMTQCINYILRK